MENTRKKIIIVDDVNYCLAGIKEGLKKNYEVFPAPSVERMFEVLQFVKPDLILLDVNMPGTSGYDAIRTLKADKGFADIPVIFLTSETDKNNVALGFKLGAADYVAKPFTPAVLIERIEYQLNSDTRKKTLRIESPRKKIFYVDDMNYNLVSIKSQLEVHYEVYPLQYFDKMFELLAGVTPDLILLDINMPEIDGYDGIMSLKTDPRYKDIPVIFLTTKGDEESIDKGYRFGASDYVVKPFTYADLIKRIDYQLVHKPHAASVTQLPQDNDLTKPLIVILDETYNMLSSVIHAMSDDYYGPLRTVVRKNFAVYYELRDKYRVEMFSKTEEVEDFLKTQKPNLFILDSKLLTETDDTNLVAKIRKLLHHKTTPIFVSTEDESMADINEYVMQEGWEFILKPIAPAALQRKIVQYLKQ